MQFTSTRPKCDRTGRYKIPEMPLSRLDEWTGTYMTPPYVHLKMGSKGARICELAQALQRSEPPCLVESFDVDVFSKQVFAQASNLPQLTMQLIGAFTAELLAELLEEYAHPEELSDKGSGTDVNIYRPFGSIESIESVLVKIQSALVEALEPSNSEGQQDKEEEEDEAAMAECGMQAAAGAAGAELIGEDDDEDDEEEDAREDDALIAAPLEAFESVLVELESLVHGYDYYMVSSSNASATPDAPACPRRRPPRCIHPVLVRCRSISSRASCSTGRSRLRPSRTSCSLSSWTTKRLCWWIAPTSIHGRAGRQSKSPSGLA